MFLKVFFVLIFIVVLFIILKRLLPVTIVRAKFEHKNSLKVINNSYLQTFKEFIDENDYEYMQGKTIFFNSWATWCGHCIKEIPLLNEIYLLNAKNENIVFVSYCSDLKPDLIAPFLANRKLELKYRFLNAREGLRLSLKAIIKQKYKSYDIDDISDGVPLNFIIDKNEKLLYYKRGRIMEEDIRQVMLILNP